MRTRRDVHITYLLTLPAAAAAGVAGVAGATVEWTVMGVVYRVANSVWTYYRIDNHKYSFNVNLCLDVMRHFAR